MEPDPNQTAEGSQNPNAEEQNSTGQLISPDGASTTPAAPASDNPPAPNPEPGVSGLREGVTITDGFATPAPNQGPETDEIPATPYPPGGREEWEQKNQREGTNAGSGDGPWEGSGLINAANVPEGKFGVVSGKAIPESDISFVNAEFPSNTARSNSQTLNAGQGEIKDIFGNTHLYQRQGEFDAGIQYASSGGQRPSPGRIVRFFPEPDTAAAVNGAQVLPAIIVREWQNGVVSLHVFTDGAGTLYVPSVVYREAKDEFNGVARSWHWPPRN